MDLASNRRNLCVISQHEDEGYLSPSEEDLLRLNSQRLRTSYLDCSKGVYDDGGGCSFNENDLGRHQGEALKESDSDYTETETPWEIIACLPDIQYEHLSWDRLKLPVPYRFFDGHKVCLRQIRKSPTVSYLTDSAKKHPKIVENIWRSSYLQKQFHPHSNSNNHPSLVLKRSQGPSSIDDVESGDLKRDNFFHIPVQQFVQHVFHLVCGRESVSFSHVKESRFSFQKNPDLLVYGLSPGTMSNFSKKYLNAGRIFKRLSLFSALHYDDNLMSREGFQRNAVFISFLKFISDYLKLYETSLMLMVPNIHSLGKFCIFFKPFSLQLETLERVLDLYVAADQITLLKSLNSMMLCCETPSVASLLRGAFITCASAYFRYVSDWIFRGTLTEGFHIQPENNRSANYQDRRYWVKNFCEVASVPAFLESIADIILETGKAINLLNLIRDKESSSSVISCILQDEYTSIQPSLEFEVVSALENEWKIKVDSFFEEFSFLKMDIETVLTSHKNQSPNHTLDFEAIEEAKLNYERQLMENRRRAQDRKAEKQKQLYDSLNQQLTEKKNREKRKKQDEKLEEEKRSSYIAAVDERDLQEEIRLMKKHFGERVVETVGVRNVRERISTTGNSTSIVDSLDSISGGGSGSTGTDVDCFHPDLNADGEGDQPGEVSESLIDMAVSISINDQGRTRRSSSKSVSFDESVNLVEEDEDADEICIADPNNERKHGKGKTVSEILKRSKTDLKREEGSLVVSAVGGEVCKKEKFDPENIKIRDTIPFNTNLDIDFSESILLPKPLAKMNCSQMSFSKRIRQDQSSEHGSFYLSNFLSQSVAIPARAQNRMVNAALLHYFIVEKQLFQNLEAMNDYLCLQNGLFGHFLTTFLVKEVNTGHLSNKEDIPKKIGRLNELLGEALALSADGVGKTGYRDKIGFILYSENVRHSIKLNSQESLKSRTLTSKYEVLDEILLNYSVDWPLSILLTYELLTLYKKLFIFQMRLYRAEVLLLEVGTILKFKGKNSAQFATLSHHRYLMLHFVRAIRHYINVTVIHCAWTELSSSFHKLNSLDKVYECLVQHIKSVITNCLLGAKGEGVMKLLLNQLTIIECYCSDVIDHCSNVDWSLGEAIEKRRFAKLDQKFKAWEEIQKVFISVVYKLANRGTYQKVSYFLQLFNFNGYFGKDLVE